MNKYKNIVFILVALVCLSSCKDSWLDINDNPNTPSSSAVSVELRLPWIQHHMLYAQGTAGMRAALITQQLTTIKNDSQQQKASDWDPLAAMSTTPYQHFFVASAANISDLIARAEIEGAYHYIGAAKAIRAMGFMLMTDWYGEMPYTEALGSAITPKFDDGKTIFEGCLAEIDEAIRYFEMTQPNTAKALSAGDSWNGGDVNKWIKMCYGLKVRWLNNLSKKSNMYKPDEILALLAKAPISNMESSIVSHQDVTETAKDALTGDPLKTSIIFNTIAMNHNFRITKWYENILVNFDNKNVEDPRADKLLPWAEFGFPKSFVRSKGVDLQSDIRLKNGPITTSYNAGSTNIDNNGRTIIPKTWYINSASTERWGDTTYVSMRSGAAGYFNEPLAIFKFADGTVGASGTFYSRPDAPTNLVTYHEMCFIKAEVLMRKGDKAGAFAAYKDGILANINLMNAKLSTYGNVNVSKSPMAQSKIDNFIANGIGNAADITMAKIMTQKYIAMSFSQQNWNDMRRHDYSANSYQNWSVPYDYTKSAIAQTKIPVGKQFRRIRQVSHEINYNSKNVILSHPNALNDDIWSFPVWWDIVE